MASLGGNVLPSLAPQTKIYLSGVTIVLFVSACFSTLIKRTQKPVENPGMLRALWLFVYSCFLKPHSGDAKGNQQDALESFYKNQAGAYDATRGALLKGREDMLALAAAQLEHRATMSNKSVEKRRIWVDVSPRSHNVSN
jgi:betaine lipid synthase